MASSNDSDSQSVPLKEASEASSVSQNSAPPKQLLDADEIRRLDSLYPPFARTDMYGSMGIGPISFLAKLHLLIASVTLFPLRAILCFLLLSFFYIVCLLATAFHSPVLAQGQTTATFANLRGFRRSIMTFFGRVVARALLFVMGFHFIEEAYCEHTSPEDGISTDKMEPGYPKQSLATCVVSNHISWVDILWHIYAHPRSLPSFVAKQSVVNVPLAGFISKCFSCIYVEREVKSRSDGGVAALIVERMKASVSDPLSPLVLLFPEGTTSNGRYLLPFKTGAFLAGTPVQPVVLQYSGPFFNPAWETIGGIRHIFLLLCQPWHSLKVTYLSLYHASLEETQDPKLYAENLRKLMATNDGLELSPLTLHDKRVYMSLLQGKDPLIQV